MPGRKLIPLWHRNDRNCQWPDVYGNHSGKLYYYLYNLQGDVIALCDASSKQIVAKYSYDAWGKLLTKEGTLADANPFRYRGYYYDSETGMYYLNSRYYDPEVGRFLNVDAFLGANVGAATFNLFAYCGNNPAVLADPTGYYVCSNCGKYTPPSGGHSCSVHPPWERKDDSLNVVESISPWGTPNSHVDDYSDGYHKERWYGDDGRATKDKHHTDHGNPNQHPNPHEQFWDWTDPEHPKLGPAQPTDATIDFDSVIGVGIVCATVAGMVWVVVNDATGIGVADDVALVPLFEAFVKGAQMAAGATS